MNPSKAALALIIVVGIVLGLIVGLDGASRGLVTHPHPWMA
jgi:hypothetical protein